MKKTAALIHMFCFSVLLLSCEDKFDVDTWFEAKEKDSVLTDIITYIYAWPQSAKWNTRFDPRFRQHYVSQLGNFKFENYYHDTNTGIHYYYIIRPARSAQGNIRGVGGKFWRDKRNKIISFREEFNTPVATLDELQQRGKELFKRMIRTGNIDDYLKHPDYIEWPNELTYYDTVRYEWRIKPGL